MNTALVWFRHDLRLADNPALLAAVRAAQHVVPVFVWSPEDEGSWAPGAAARWWLNESLRSLDASLRERGSQLVLRCGATVPALMVLAQEAGATQIYWNCRYEPAARKVEESLRRELEQHELLGHGFHSSRLMEPGKLCSANGAPYRVFTPFHRAFVKQVAVHAPQASPRHLPAPPLWPHSLPIEALQLLRQTPRHSPWHQKLATHWQPGEAGARQALKRFSNEGLAHYSGQRDRPDLLSTSRLSPYLRHGELSPHQVWTSVVKSGQRQGKPAGFECEDKFIAELVWREFATQQLVVSPLLPDRPRDARFEHMPWRNEPAQLRAWSYGQTGVAMVDAGMRELWQTGWMHNRVRMITASFLVKNLLHDWRLGQRWFWDTLVDADLASNAYNWQWVAGCSPEAAPWFRIFNPLEQAKKFDPDGKYRERYLGIAAAAGGNTASTLAASEQLTELKASRQRALDAWATCVSASAQRKATPSP